MRVTDEPLDEQEAQVWRRLAMLLVLLPRALEDDLQEKAGISLTHYTVLMHLSEAPERQLRMSDLAARATISPSRMTRVVQSLESHGWVARSESPHDGRANLARLTDAGLARIREAWPTHLASVRRLVLDHLDPEALGGVAGVLGRIVDAAVADACHPPPQPGQACDGSPVTSSSASAPDR